MKKLNHKNRRNAGLTYLTLFIYLPTLVVFILEVDFIVYEDFLFGLMSLFLLTILFLRLTKDILTGFPNTIHDIVVFFVLQCGGLLFVVLLSGLGSAINSWLFNAAIIICAASLSLAIESIIHEVRGTSAINSDISMTGIIYYGVLPSMLLFVALLLYLQLDISLGETLLTIGSFIFALLFHMSIFLRLRLREMFS
jgi:hypothetical protein